MIRHLFVLCLIVLLAETVAAQEGVVLRITGFDVSRFPVVKVNLITADSQSAPVTDLSSLSLRENGIPIGDLEIAEVSVGIDVIFVIDANTSYQQVDVGSDVSRQEKVRESLIEFANRYMGDMDRVSIIVPNESAEVGRFLVEDATAAVSVIEAIEGYNPTDLSRTPLNEMMTLALAHAADGQKDGCFQAVLLFTDGAQLHQQLTYSTLVARANEIFVPIFAAILGARADANEIDNVARLYEPTHGTYIHLADPAATDPIYSTWQQQQNQTQVAYRSLQTKSGRYPIAINLGAARALTELELTIAPPEVVVEIQNAVIRRLGNAPDTPLSSLEPNQIPLTVTVHWPDGIRRPLTTLNLFLDDRPRLALTTVTPDADNIISLDLDIAELDVGTYAVVVQVTDELGLSAASEPFTLVIEVERPLPPTPTTIPTSVPEPTETTAPPAAVASPNRWFVPLLIIGFITTTTLLWLRRRARAAKRTKLEQVPSPSDSDESSSKPPENVILTASLELLEETPGHITHIRIEGDNVTVGRDHQSAQIVINDQSVARLHARIKKRDGQYWLYDEGSSSGTFLNYERLGLMPNLLADQDVIFFGHVGLRFHLQQTDE